MKARLNPNWDSNGQFLYTWKATPVLPPKHEHHGVAFYTSKPPQSTIIFFCL